MKYKGEGVSKSRKNSQLMMQVWDVWKIGEEKGLGSKSLGLQHSRKLQRAHSRDVVKWLPSRKPVVWSLRSPACWVTAWAVHRKNKTLAWKPRKVPTVLPLKVVQTKQTPHQSSLLKEVPSIPPCPGDFLRRKTNFSWDFAVQVPTMSKALSSNICCLFFLGSVSPHSKLENV